MRKVWFLLFALLFLLPFSTLLAQEIDFLWQGEVYTPPFYDGRPLWTSQSRVTIMAVPSIPGITNPLALYYKWTKDNTVLGTANGVGQNSISFNDSVLGKPVDIILEVLSLDSDVLARETITLSPLRPTLLVYEDSPLYGVLFHKEVVDSYTLSQEEITFVSFPLFFSTQSQAGSSVSLSWNPAGGSSLGQSAVTYRAPEGVSGSSQVTLRAEHTTRMMQFARKNFIVKFGR